MPDGIYTVTAEAADANGSTASTAEQEQVMTQPIGQLTAPTSGQTISGNLSYTFVPNPAYTVTAVGFPCVQGVEQSDGSWQATVSSSGCLGNGAHTVSASVTWTDALGVPRRRPRPRCDHGFEPDHHLELSGGNQAFNPRRYATVAATASLMRPTSPSRCPTRRTRLCEPSSRGCQSRPDVHLILEWDGTDDTAWSSPDGTTR